MLRSVLPDPVGPTITINRLVLIVVVVVAFEILEFVHDFSIGGLFVLVVGRIFRRIVLIRCFGVGIDFAWIRRSLLGLVDACQLQLVGTVPEQIEQVDQPIAVMVDDLPERDVLHGFGTPFFC